MLVFNIKEHRIGIVKTTYNKMNCELLLLTYDTPALRLFYQAVIILNILENIFMNKRLEAIESM
jgi:hypothetical protein